MQRHSRDKLENAIFIGIIALLAVFLVLFVGHDINTNVVNDFLMNNMHVSGNEFYLGAAIFITLCVILFISSVLGSLRAESSSDKNEKLKEFVSECEKRGYSKWEIVGLLGGHGWTKQEIDKYF
jgi:choline-glycine betaine transporter